MPTWVGFNETSVGDRQAICGEAISAQELVTIRTDGGDDLAYAATAAALTADVPALGMAHADYEKGEMGLFHSVGMVRDLDPCVDGYYYLSNTPGEFGTVAGNTSQVVAVATDGANGTALLDFQNIAHNHPAAS